MEIYLGRTEVKEKTEELLDEPSRYTFAEIEKELLSLGFIQSGSDPASVEFQHTGVGLMLVLELDEDGDVHSYELLTIADMNKKQRRFRW